MTKLVAWITTFGLLSNACQPARPTQKAPSPASQSPVIQGNATAWLTDSATPESHSTATLQPTRPFTPIPSLTPTAAAGSPTSETGTSGAPATSTLEPLSIDRLPAGTVYRTIIIENRSRTHADISLHCTTRQGLKTVLEYSEIRTKQIEAPEGNYVYVVHVGGKQLIGGFSLFQISKLTITIYKDRVAIH